MATLTDIGHRFTPLSKPDIDWLHALVSDWQLLAGLAHDLRSPLQALRLLVTVLEGSGPLTEAQRSVLERVRTSAERAVAIGLDVLD